MSFHGKNELKHLLNPETGEWIPEFDPVFAVEDACATCYGATTKTIHTVDSGKKCYLYSLLVSNVGDSGATYAILNGATIKIPPIYIIAEDVHQIPQGPNPRAPILKFGAAESIKVRTSGATIMAVISYWEAESE